MKSIEKHRDLILFPLCIALIHVSMMRADAWTNDQSGPYTLDIVFANEQDVEYTCQFNDAQRALREYDAFLEYPTFQEFRDSDISKTGLGVFFDVRIIEVLGKKLRISYDIRINHIHGWRMMTIDQRPYRLPEFSSSGLKGEGTFPVGYWIEFGDSTQIYKSPDSNNINGLFRFRIRHENP